MSHLGFKIVGLKMVIAIFRLYFYLNAGILEYWKGGKVLFVRGCYLLKIISSRRMMPLPIIPVFHHSGIPTGAKPLAMPFK